MRVPFQHRSAGGWPPGLVVPAGTHVDRRVLPRVVPHLAFNRLAEVPIGPYGFAQGIIPGFATTTGSITSPTAFQTFLTVAIPAGTYTVNWTVTLSGTVGAPDANNFGLTLGSGPTLAAPSVNAGATGTYPQAAVTFTITAPDTLNVKSWGNTGTTGAVYGATITGTSTSLIISIGPAGAGTSWELAQASISTTTGAADASTCALFIQPAGIPNQNWQAGFSYAGGGDQIGLSGYKMVPGERLYAVWSGGRFKDTASLILTGLMRALV